MRTSRLQRPDPKSADAKRKRAHLLKLLDRLTSQGALDHATSSSAGRGIPAPQPPPQPPPHHAAAPRHAPQARLPTVSTGHSLTRNATTLVRCTRRYVVVRASREPAARELELCVRAEGPGAAAGEGVLVLAEDWYETPAEPGHVLHVVLLGASVDAPPLTRLDNATPALCVLNPDVLMSPSVIGESFFCDRKAVMAESIFSQASSAAMLNGILVHDLFEHTIASDDRSAPAMQRRIRQVIVSHIPELYHTQTTEEAAAATLEKASHSIMNWCDVFLRQEPAPASAIPLDPAVPNQSTPIAIKRVLATEDTLWCRSLGLKGIVDATLLVAPKGRDSMILPFELKTGKHANISVSHKAQIALYTTMAAEHTDPPPPLGLIYYLGGDSMQAVTTSLHDMRGLFIKRNFLAHELEAMSLPGVKQSAHACSRCSAVAKCAVLHKAVEDGTEESFGAGPVFDTLVKHITMSEAQYLASWYRLLLLESKSDSARSGDPGATPDTINGLTVDGKPQVLAERNEYLYKMDLAADDPADLMSWSFAVGDRVLASAVRRARRGTWAIVRQGVARGYIRGIRAESIWVAFRRPLVLLNTVAGDIEDLVAGGAVTREAHECLWRIEANDQGFRCSTAQSFLVRLFTPTDDPADDARAKRLRELVVDLAPPQMRQLDPRAPIRQALADVVARTSLNAGQQSAVEAILAKSEYVNILGMPGTGKTSTIAAAVELLIREPGCSVLIASHTNTAVDNILLKLQDAGVDFLRVGRREVVHPLLQEKLLAQDRFGSVAELDDFVQSKRVVASTAMGMTNPLFAKMRFSVCIIDEASQISQPTCIGPLLLADRFVLVGDHHQLPPLVRSQEAREGGMDVSLFKRLADQHAESISYLTTQYRMRRDIMQLCNKLIYRGAITCGSEAVATAQLPACVAILPDALGPDAWLADVLAPDVGAVFVNTDRRAGGAQEAADGLSNPVEADLIAQIVRDGLIGFYGMSPIEIGVISPYRAQVRLLRRKLAQGPLGSRAEVCETNTVDKYQGRDKDVILISMVKSNPSRLVGRLLADWRRLNVAITRGKKKLVIVGSGATLSSLKIIRKLLELVREHGREVYA